MRIQREIRRASSVGVLLAVLVGGCDWITGLDDPALAFQVDGREPGAVGPDSIWVPVSRIHVAGTALGSGGVQPEASLDADGNSLVLSIEPGSTDDEGGSHTGITDWRYQAEIGPLDAGTYSLTIRQWKGRRYLETMSDTTLMIAW